MIQRRKLSELLMTTLETELIVGLASSPAQGGWEGTPNDDGSNFAPYAVLYPSTGGPGAPNPAPIRPTEWRLNYAVSAYGISPDQAEWVADKARLLLAALDNTNVQLGPDDYRIQQVYPAAIGQVIRADAADPPYWGQTDTYTVWLSKEL